jgi:hypothetical protein
LAPAARGAAVSRGLGLARWLLLFSNGRNVPEDFMSSHSLLRLLQLRVLRWVALTIGAPALWACTSRALETPTVTPTQVANYHLSGPINRNIDILFMIDDSSSMSAMQTKLQAQLPTFMNVLQGLPMVPSLHIAVVSSDMGAPSDQQASIGCSATGDSGVFFSQPEGICTATGLATGATFISDADNLPNFGGDIAQVFQCIALLGQSGCGFEHQLASIDRALGADGRGPPPAASAGFLRPEAYLGIVLLTNEDDCSAPPETTLFSLNGGAQDLSNPLGPIANYRCNRFGHLCRDGAGPLQAPPLNPPPDAKAGTMPGAMPTLALTECESNEAGMLIPVGRFVSDIKALKPDPDNQILVAAVAGPATPYTVDWVQDANQPAGQPWPQIEHACGPSSDGSFADPSVRISQFVRAFGQNGVTSSICDPSYASAMTVIAERLIQFIKPTCVDAHLQTDSLGNPNCAVDNHLTNNGVTRDISVPACAENGNVAPCWSLTAGGTNCAAGTLELAVSTDPSSPTPESLSSTIECAICTPGTPAPGC